MKKSSEKAALNKRLLKLLPAGGPLTKNLDRALVYCIKTGGKRIRPLLFMEVVRIVKGDLAAEMKKKVLDFACGIEFIHAYSLVHDDIMDGDDMRRGKATVCKKFGVPTAILAGDALLTKGLEILYGSFPEAAAIINAGVGSPGMIAGQAADMEQEGKKSPSEKALWYTHLNKTAAFFSSVCAAGAASAGADGKNIRRFASFGRRLGMAFQVRDDVLDRVGDIKKYRKSRNDEKNKKLTVLRFHNLAQAMRMVNEISLEAEGFLQKLPYDTSALLELSGALREREF
ncbi:MAG: farnesyl-diphosphate synthase [Elusimicrobia bacterium CG03_land_8_20_14_0_80_50_18]|nr:MAG: farnesyl-diphosphate synthase [Elusimicrobia bacterium CG03_land_8_20_14_0_80_50_18]PIX14183.1 MAG: farnesyl-diphosphate synthase [Elusimicrobia bacterium CG_4_8_14_3_um_filter_50_9]